MNLFFCQFLYYFAFLVLHFAFFSPSTLWAENSCEGLIINSISIEGCKGSKCEDKDEYQKFLSLSDIRTGMNYSEASVKKAEQRLLKTGFFKSVRASCSISSNNEVDLKFNIVGNNFIKEIEIEGNKYFYKSDILKRVFIHEGDVFNPDEKESEEIKKKQIESIRKLYETEGFRGSAISIDSKFISDNYLRLIIKINEGERRKIGKIKVKIKKIFADKKSPKKGLMGVFLEECPEIKPRDVKEFSKISTGDSYTEKKVSEVIKNVRENLMMLGYKNPSVFAKYDEKEGELKIIVGLKECFLIKFFLREEARPGDEGFRFYYDEDLLKILPFKDSGVFDIEEARIGLEEIKNYFENRGYLFSNISLDYRLYPEKTVENVADNVFGAITYFITLNQKAEIRKIIFKGNKSFDDETFLSLMETKVYDFFGEGGYLLIDQLFYDLEKIKRLYLREGYFNFKFNYSKGIPVKKRESYREGKKEIYIYSFEDKGFKVIKAPREDSIYIEINIDEGTPSKLKQLIITGNNNLSEKEIMKIIPIQIKKNISGELIKETLSKIKDTYRSMGYYMVKVNISCRTEKPSLPPAQCSAEFIKAEDVYIYISIEEGEQFFVGEIFVNGNFRTREGVILRDFPLTGTPYDLLKLTQAERGLRDLGIFSSIVVNKIGLDETPPRKKIAFVIQVRESHVKYVDIAVGFETLNRTGGYFPHYITSPLSTTISITDKTGTGFGRSLPLQIPDLLIIGEVSYVDANFFGMAKELLIPVKYGLSSTSLSRYASFTPTYIDSRFFIKGLIFQFTPYVIYDRATKTLDEFEFGASFRLSKRILKKTTASLEYEIGEITTKDPYVESDFLPFRLQNKINPALIIETLDNPINPKDGIFLGSSLSYLNAWEEKEFKDFLKYEFSFKLFFSVKKTVVFSNYLHYGNSEAFEGDDLPPDERFTLGGNKGVRGFSDDGISQYNPDGSLVTILTKDGKYIKPYGGDMVINGSFEIRFPLIKTLNFWGCSFFDYGALSEKWDELSLKSFRMSVGLGLRWLIAGQIPLRLDYGLILDRRCKFVDIKTGKCIVDEEVGNIHFGILYSF